MRKTFFILVFAAVLSILMAASVACFAEEGKPIIPLEHEFITETPSGFKAASNNELLVGNTTTIINPLFILHARHLPSDSDSCLLEITTEKKKDKGFPKSVSTVQLGDNLSYELNFKDKAQKKFGKSDVMHLLFTCETDKGETKKIVITTR